MGRWEGGSASLQARPRGEAALHANAAGRASLKARAPIWIGRRDAKRCAVTESAPLSQPMSPELPLFVAAVTAAGLFASPNWRVFADLPHGLARAAIAGGLGLLSAMMGIGGGAIGVTVMTLCCRPIHQAVATASGFGAAIALPAALGYVLMGWGQGRPAALVARLRQPARLHPRGRAHRHHRAPSTRNRCCVSHAHATRIPGTSAPAAQDALRPLRAAACAPRRR